MATIIVICRPSFLWVNNEKRPFSFHCTCVSLL